MLLVSVAGRCELGIGGGEKRGEYSPKYSPKCRSRYVRAASVADGKCRFYIRL